MKWIASSIVLLAAVACQTGDNGYSSGTTGSEVTGSTGASSSTSSSTGAEDATGTGTSSSTGGSVMASCEDAATEAECDALAAEVYGCAWLPTHRFSIGPDGTCEDMNMDGGRCMLIEEESGCGDPTPPTCPRSFGTVFFDPTTVGRGSVELLVAEQGVCVGGLPGYEVCELDGDGETGTGTGTTGGASTSGGIEPSWNPPECECACL